MVGFLTSFMVKFDSSGNTLWVRTGGDYLASINDVNLATDSFGNAYMIGDFTGDSIMFGSNVVHKPVTELETPVFQTGEAEWYALKCAD